MMLNYQALLDDIVTLLAPERGFIVLREPSTNKPTEFTALYNFDAAAAQEPIGDETDEEQYIWEVLPRLFAEDQPFITDNTIHDVYYRRIFNLKRWILRSVIIVPLKREAIVYGLMWCDKGIGAHGQWTPQDLEQAVALVERSEKS